MSIIWDTLINCKEQIIKEFDSRGKEIQEEGMAQFNQPTTVGLTECGKLKIVDVASLM